MSVSKNKTGLHVALAFDEKFAVPAYATMRSICLMTTRRKELVFHLCHPGLGKKSLGILEKLTEEFGAKIVHYDLGANNDYQHFAAILPHTKHISAVMYARMMLDQIVPSDILRLVYVDCDLLIRAPIEELILSELGGLPVGAIKEPHSLRFAHGSDAVQNHDLFDSADPFFNSGVMVMDLDLWRKNSSLQKLREAEKSGALARLANDQQVLNFLFKNNWKQLDGAWNMFGVSRAIEGLDPKIVHYTGLNKPWNMFSGLPFARVYRHVMTNDLFYSYMRQRWAQKFKWLGRKLTFRG